MCESATVQCEAENDEREQEAVKGGRGRGNERHRANRNDAVVGRVRQKR